MKRKLVLIILFAGIWLSSLGGCNDDYGNNESGIHSNGNNEIKLYEDPPGFMGED